MRTLTDHEKRTVRIGAAVVGAYLVLFYGLSGWKGLEARRGEYHQLRGQAQELRQEMQAYEKKALSIQRLRKEFQINPAKLSKETLVAEASAAIQKAAAGGGVQLGPIRESSARASARELVSMQLEGSGPVAAVMGLLHRLQTLGYPVVLDSIQLTAESAKPGTIKLSLTIVILDYEQWKNLEARHA